MGIEILENIPGRVSHLIIDLDAVKLLAVPFLLSNAT